MKKKIDLNIIMKDIDEELLCDAILEKLARGIQIYKKLPQKRKIQIIKGIIDVINRADKKQRKEDIEDICREEGHIFTDWEYTTWTTYHDERFDNQLYPNFPTKHELWTRVCTRCGYKEEVTIEPEELRFAREEQERNAKIKKLQLELNKLTGNKGD